jgi:predicted RecA/RadA family phage recombinase
MAQATYIQAGREIDYTPGADVDAGEVVIQQGLVGIAKTAIASGKLGALSVSGIFDVDQAAEAINVGDAVYWDADGTSVSGTASEGAATATATGNTFMGFALATTEASDSYVRVNLRSAEVVAGGVATATSITGTASTLPIAGLAAAQGGAVSITAGASSTAANAGGAVTLVGGAAGAEGVGGAASVTGGAGGTTSGAGGAAAVTGGAAASAASNAVGGAASVTGGIGKGNLAGGAIAITGGKGGATGLGGAVAITGGAGGATSGHGGAVTIAGGAADDDDDNGGNVTILGGAKDGSGTDGVLALGTSNTSAINVGAAAITTAVAGPLTHRQAIVDATSDITLTAAQSGSLVLLNTSDLVKLPAVSGLTGVFYDFVAITVATTAPLIDPAGSEVITIGAAAQTGGEAIEPTAIGDSCRLVCTGTAWVSTHLNGTWAGADD